MPRVKTFAHGGILVESYRSLTHAQPTRLLSLPSLAVVSLQQYPGAKAEWLVSPGDYVQEDQVLATGLRPQDIPLHSPIPGRVEKFQDLVLPNKTTVSTALIRLEGSFERTGRPVQTKDWQSIASDVLLRRLWELGVYLESGSLDPVQNILEVALPLEALVVNALQSEPYLTLNAHLCREKTSELIEGLRIVQKIFSPRSTHFATDDPTSADAVESIVQALPSVQIHHLEFKYPQAEASLLLKTVLGSGRSSIGSRERSKFLILDLASILAVYEAIVEGKAMTEKRVVLSGQAVVHPGVYRVRIGTPIAQLIHEAGGLKSEPAKLLLGGPFKGLSVELMSTPITKSTDAVLALTDREVNDGKTLECIRCGQCSDSCPANLEPINLFKALERGRVGQAFDEGLGSCISCGICAFVCPSRIPLLAEFERAKGGLHG